MPQNVVLYHQKSFKLLVPGFLLLFCVLFVYITYFQIELLKYRVYLTRWKTKIFKKRFVFVHLVKSII